MRPGDFSPGNAASGELDFDCVHGASMRPGDFSPGNETFEPPLLCLCLASMRPGDFSPGNLVERGLIDAEEALLQ